MARINYEQLNEMSSGNNNEMMRYFSLKDDGDEAIVRIMHDSCADFDIVTAHKVNVGGRYRNVNCLREIGRPVEDCPFCAAKINTSQVFYVHLIQYVKDETGKVTPTPVLWSRSARQMSQKLNSLIEEYGPLSDCIFKIRRNGKAGDMHTTYEILYGNPNVYREDIYPKVPNAFEGYEVVGKQVLNKNAEEMQYFLENNQFPERKQKNTNSLDEIVDDTPDTVPTQPPVYNTSSATHAPVGVTPNTTTTSAPQRPVRYY